MTQATPLPSKQMAVLSTVIFCEPVSLLILFPFVIFMVRDFKIAKNEDEVGYYVGYIASSFAFAQMCSGMFWGWLSDRLGRKPILLLGLLGNTISITLFGLSKSFAWAITSRLACGLLNGNVVVAKSMLSEITDAHNEGKAFTLFGVAFGLGSIVGPMLGGLLSHPAEQFPSIFGNIAFFHKFPYFLPCFVSAWFSLFGLVMGYVYLHETKPNKIYSENNVDENTSLIQRDSGMPSSKRIQDIIGNSILSAIIPFSAISFVQVVFDETFSLWSSSPPSSGGLSFTSREIGLALTYIGFVGLFVQILLYPKVQRKLGTIFCFRYAMLLYGVVFLLLPNVTFIANYVEGGNAHRIWVWIGLLAVLTLRVFSASFAFTSSMILVSNASKQSGAVGVVNGFSQCLASLVRTIGPAMGGTLWSWSLLNGLSFPLNHYFIFLLLSALSILSYLQTYYINPVYSQ